MGYTKIPNWLLDSHNDIDPAPFRVLCCIYRYTQGFHRPTYKINISKLIKMSGVKAISRCFKILKDRGFIEYEYLSGKSNVITIKPMKSVDDTNEMSASHQSSELNGSRGAKENNKENLNKDDLLLKFKNQYPADKIDDNLDEAWKSISEDDKQIAVGVLEYQNNLWKDPNFNRKFIPKASNWLLKQSYLVDMVKKPYDDELLRKRQAIKQSKSLEEAKKNAASQSEIREILSTAIKKKK